MGAEERRQFFAAYVLPVDCCLGRAARTCPSKYDKLKGLPARTIPDREWEDAAEGARRKRDWRMRSEELLGKRCDASSVHFLFLHAAARNMSL